ncbi:MAG: hypothetical protein WC756_08685 [Taibaiella sp.]|jgi:hypothetical protein
MRIVLLLAYGILISSTAFTQGRQLSALPQTPQSTTFKPVIINTATRTVIALPNPNVTASDINKQDQERLKQQQKELDLINQEVAKYKRESQRPKTTIRLIDTAQCKKELAIFYNALLQLKNLLANNANPSLADAFYITENAYGNSYLTRKEYDDIINKSADFIKRWMQQNKYDINNNDDKHLAIQKFMSEKLTIAEAHTAQDGKIFMQQSGHLPFFYDFEDYEAKDDHRNFFVTKCLATGGGQCNSMPMVYLLLAEKLNTPAYLSFAPQHALVKYIDNSGETINYEATNNWRINNLWYQENLFISPDAVRSGIYLDTLSKQKIVANCMIDLAIQYARNMPNDDGKFIQDCLWESHFYFPKNNNIYAYFVYSILLKGWLAKYIALHHITDLEQIKNDEWAYNLQKEYQQNEAYIKELGYRDLPEGLYNDIVQQAELKRGIQKQQRLSGKTKRNLFVTVQ